ncbi:MAG: quercetin 2,3-dioxygenase [Desulfuromonas sp.]|nr:MAG: quercetin 2,3-dioxygenase [Desulfuromonas sp.]
MITLRPHLDRGHSQYDWLDSRFSFSFADYYDPDQMGFSTLRVINEDHIRPGGSFDMHPHRDMEILTYIIKGELLHQDSLGHRETIRSGELQRITAGRGIFHSESNPSDEEVHLLQIWIFPREHGLDPSYETMHFPAVPPKGLQLLASADGRDGSATMQQDAALFHATVNAGETLSYSVTSGRRVWLQLIRGSLKVNGTALGAGDGAAISDEETLLFAASEDARFLLFNL